MNALTWLTAVLLSQTSQLRASWFLLVAVLVAGTFVEEFSWGRDLGFVGIFGLIVLGFPGSLILFLLPWRVLPTAWGVAVEIGVTSLIVGILYMQAFVLLPRLFRETGPPVRRGLRGTTLGTASDDSRSEHADS
jgi:hypothetical protein